MAKAIYNRDDILAQYDLLCRELEPLLAKADIHQGLKLLREKIKKYPHLKAHPEFWTNHKHDIKVFDIRGGFSEEIRGHYFYFDYDLDEEDKLLDLYVYYVDGNHWLCYSSPYYIRPYGQDDVLATPIYSQGQWFICNENGEDPYWRLTF